MPGTTYRTRGPTTATVDYYLFAFADWTPERVKFCLMHWPVLEEAVQNGIERGDWPPSLGSSSAIQAYPKNMSILATAADMHIALRKLPPREAVAIRAYYFAKWTQTEIAQHLDCSQRWASALIERGEVAFIQHLCGG